MEAKVKILGGLEVTVDFEFNDMDSDGIDFKVTAVEGRMIGKTENTYWIERRMTEQDYNKIEAACITAWKQQVEHDKEDYMVAKAY